MVFEWIVFYFGGVGFCRFLVELFLCFFFWGVILGMISLRSCV